MRISGLAIMALAFITCAQEPDDAHRVAHMKSELAMVRETQGAAAHAIGALDDRSRALAAQAKIIIQDFTAAEREFEAARGTFDLATKLVSQSKKAFSQAAADYQAAEAAYRRIAITLIVAAASDLVPAVCSARVNTSTYRHHLEEKGISLKGVTLTISGQRALGARTTR